MGGLDSPYNPTTKPYSSSLYWNSTIIKNTKKRNILLLTFVTFLCSFFYLFAVWQNRGNGLAIATACTTLHNFTNLGPLDFVSRHTADQKSSISDLNPIKVYPPCDVTYSEYTPCEDRRRSVKFTRSRLIYRERHCPTKKELLKCRIPAPYGYKSPFKWPVSRDYVWYDNVPHKHLTVEKAVQNWIRFEGDRFKFPGGGTMFPHGADSYIDDIGKLINLNDGSIRTAIDTGCGVASWGAYLLSRNISTISFAPRDTHEAQVQFALERGVPALIGVIASKRLPYPSRAFDMAHCSRCLIPWDQYDGVYLIEVDRVLRPGGYWILSGPPIRWKKYWKGWERSKEDLNGEQTRIENLAKSLCWKKVVEKGDIAIWQKPINHMNCKRTKKVNATPHFCPAQNFDQAWAVQRLDLVKSRASVLTSDITTVGNSLFFLGSRLGDSLLVQYTSGTAPATSGSSVKEEVGDIEGDAPSMKRLRRSSSDALQDMVGGEELSLYGSTSNKADSTQKSFAFAVRDSLINIGPLKDFSYGLRINANPNATGLAKQSNYELVCCSGHGKNGALCILQCSIRPEMITEVELPGVKGIWTVYHKSSRSHNSDASKIVAEEDEYHAYLIISLEARTMVLETAGHLGEVTESVDYYVQGSTIAAGNLFGRRRVIQVYARGARILDGSFMTQELNFGPGSNDTGSGSDSIIVSAVSIADPFVLLKMSDGSVQFLVGDPSNCTVSVNVPSVFEGSKKSITACTLYNDRGPEPWLRKASTDAWLSTGVGETIDGPDGVPHDGDIYCITCYDNGTLEIFDVPSFKCVFSVEKFISGKAYLTDSYINELLLEPHEISKNSEDKTCLGRKENMQNIKVSELAMHRWSGQHSRPFLFGILTDGTILCYHAYLFEAQENAKYEDGKAGKDLIALDSASSSRLRNLRFLRVPLDMHSREEVSAEGALPRISIFKNVGGHQGFFLSGMRPAWFMVFRERLRVHPQLCDGSVVAFTVLHNVNCNHGFIYVTSQGLLKICQLPCGLSYDNYWPVQKIPLKGTPHQVTYFAEKNLYPLIVSFPVMKPLNQILSSLVDQETGHQIDHENLSSDELQRTYTIDAFEIRILEPEKSGGIWQTKATIPMQSSENALTVRMVTLLNTTTKENETLLAVGTAYVQGEDVAARGRVLLYALGRSDNPQNLVTEIYCKELKGAISALASLQGHLLIAAGPKIILHKWTGTDLNGVAFFDAPPLHVVSLNIVKNFILLGDIHRSIYFLSWKEQGSQLSLLAKDFGSLDCFSTEFLIDGSTLSLVVSDEHKNVQIFYYAPKLSESWKGQKLLSRAEFHIGAHVTKFLRLQMLPALSDRPNATPGPDKTNRYALLFGTLVGSIGCIAPLDELTFRRLQSLQRKLVDAAPHVAGLNPKSFRQFQSNGRAHRPGPENIVDCELLCHYEMLPLEEQVEIAHQIGTTRSQILSNLNDLSLGTSFL